MEFGLGYASLCPSYPASGFETASSDLVATASRTHRIVGRDLQIINEVSMRIAIDPPTVTANFAKLKDNKAFQESAQLFARGLPVLEMLQAMSMNERVLHAFAAFETIYPGGSLERGVLEKVILRVSQLHECQFCINSHLDIMRSFDIAVDLQDASRLSDREAAAIAYAEAVTRDANRINEEVFDRIKANYTEAEIVELTFLIGLITLLNWFNNALRVRYRGELSGKIAGTGM
jgi:alkylhydroperoxidase family enzyme